MTGTNNTVCPAMTWRPAEDESYYGYSIIVLQEFEEYHTTQIRRLYPRKAEIAWRSLTHYCMESAWSEAESVLFENTGAEAIIITLHDQEGNCYGETGTGALGASPAVAKARVVVHVPMVEPSQDEEVENSSSEYSENEYSEDDHSEDESMDEDVQDDESGYPDESTGEQVEAVYSPQHIALVHQT